MLQDKPIGKRLNLGFALLAGMLVLAGAAGIVGAGIVQRGLSRMFAVSLPAIDSLIEADRDLQQLLVAERTMIFVDVKNEQFGKLVAEYEKNLGQSEERFNAFKALAEDPQERELIAKYEAARKDWLAASSQIVEGRKSDTREGRRLALDMSLREAADKFEAMRDFIDQLTQLSLDRAAKDEAHASRVFWITLGVICFITLASIVIGQLFCRRVTRSIIKPLAEILDASDAIAKGDFARKIAYTAKDEVGRLADSLRAMLSGVIGQGQSIKKGIPLPMFIANAKGVPVFANAGLEKIVLSLTGRAAGDMLGQASVGELLPDKGGRLAADVANCLSEGRIIADEREFALKNGAMVVQFTIAPLLDLDGARIGAMGIGVDLTEQKTQNRRIREQQEQIITVAEQASGISEALSMASSQLLSQVERVAQGAGKQSERATETATAMEEMNATVLEVAKNAGQAAESADSAKDKAISGQDIVNKMVGAIHEADALTAAMRENLNKLGDQAQDIGQIMNVISDIADQTNLLALNAAIEAARAGEAGRGFAVVADEVRKLAEKTMQATKQVGDAVRSIQDGAKASMTEMERASEAVSQSAGLAGEAGGALGKIVDIVEATTDQVRSIATASEEQSAASEEINRAVEDINRISGETAEGMAQADEAVGELARQAEELKRLIQALSADEENKALPV